VETVQRHARCSTTWRCVWLQTWVTPDGVPPETHTCCIRSADQENSSGICIILSIRLAVLIRLAARVTRPFTSPRGGMRWTVSCQMPGRRSSKDTARASARTSDVSNTSFDSWAPTFLMQGSSSYTEQLKEIDQLTYYDPTIAWSSIMAMPTMAPRADRRQWKISRGRPAR